MAKNKIVSFDREHHHHRRNDKFTTCKKGLICKLPTKWILDKQGCPHCITQQNKEKNTP